MENLLRLRLWKVTLFYLADKGHSRLCQRLVKRWGRFCLPVPNAATASALFLISNRESSCALPWIRSFVFLQLLQGYFRSFCSPLPIAFPDKFFQFFCALPLSISCSAIRTPSSRDSALPVTYRAAPALRQTAQRFGPLSAPLKMAQVMAAFSSGVPPVSSSLPQRAYPNVSCSEVL